MRSPGRVFLALICLTLTAMACKVTFDIPTPAPTIEGAPSETAAEEIPEHVEPTLFVPDLPTTVPPTATVAGPPGLQYLNVPALTYIRMFDASNGWAAGVTTLLRTIDGGMHWFNATPPELRYIDYEDFFPLDALSAWLTIHNPDGISTTIYRTKDGGQNWEVINVPLENISQLYFLDATNGYATLDLGAAAGSHYIAIEQTRDGGQTWEEVFAHHPDEDKTLPENGSKNGLSFLNFNNGWIGGNSPAEGDMWFYRTTDRGATWEKVFPELPVNPAPVFMDVKPARFFPPAGGILPVRIMNTDGQYYSIFYSTSNGGESWNLTSAIPDAKTFDFIAVSDGWASDGETLMRTFDGAVTWIRLAHTGLPAGERFFSIDFVDATNGWALTTSDINATAYHLYRTADGGATWTPILP